MHEAEPERVDTSQINWEGKYTEKKKANETLAAVKSATEKAKRVNAMILKLDLGQQELNYSSIDFIRDLSREFSEVPALEFNGKILRKTTFTFPEHRTPFILSQCRKLNLRSESEEILNPNGTKMIQTQFFTNNCLQPTQDDVLLLDIKEIGRTYTYVLNQDFFSKIVESPSVHSLLPLSCQSQKKSVTCSNLSLNLQTTELFVHIDQFEFSEDAPLLIQSNVTVTHKLGVKYQLHITMDRNYFWSVQITHSSGEETLKSNIIQFSDHEKEKLNLAIQELQALIQKMIKSYAPPKEKPS